MRKQYKSKLWTIVDGRISKMTFVVRRTPNPRADLNRGWSAWNGQYEEHPLSLSEVGNWIDKNDIHGDDIPDDPSEAAEWINDESPLYVKKCKTTGLWAVRHHDGLSSYELTADSLESALAEAKNAKHNYITGGVCAINPKSFYYVADDIYVFECESIEAQHDS